MTPGGVLVVVLVVEGIKRALFAPFRAMNFGALVVPDQGLQDGHQRVCHKQDSPHVHVGYITRDPLPIGQHHDGGIRSHQTIPQIRGLRTLVYLDFKPLPDNRTELTLRNFGYGDGEDWAKSKAYFFRAWPAVMASLEKRFMPK